MKRPPLHGNHFDKAMRAATLIVLALGATLIVEVGTAPWVLGITIAYLVYFLLSRHGLT